MTDRRITREPDEVLTTKVSDEHAYGPYTATLHKNKKGEYTARFNGVSSRRADVFRGMDESRAITAFKRRLKAWIGNELRLNQKHERRQGTR